MDYRMRRTLWFAGVVLAGVAVLAVIYQIAQPDAASLGSAMESGKVDFSESYVSDLKQRLVDATKRAEEAETRARLAQDRLKKAKEAATQLGVDLAPDTKGIPTAAADTPRQQSGGFLTQRSGEPDTRAAHGTDHRKPTARTNRNREAPKPEPVATQKSPTISHAKQVSEETNTNEGGDAQDSEAHDSKESKTPREVKREQMLEKREKAREVREKQKKERSDKRKEEMTKREDRRSQRKAKESSEEVVESPPTEERELSHREKHERAWKSRQGAAKTPKRARQSAASDGTKTAVKKVTTQKQKQKSVSKIHAMRAEDVKVQPRVVRGSLAHQSEDIPDYAMYGYDNKDYPDSVCGQMKPHKTNCASNSLLLYASHPNAPKLKTTAPLSSHRCVMPPKELNINPQIYEQMRACVFENIYFEPATGRFIYAHADNMQADRIEQMKNETMVWNTGKGQQAWRPPEVRYAPPKLSSLKELRADKDNIVEVRNIHLFVDRYVHWNFGHTMFDDVIPSYSMTRELGITEEVQKEGRFILDKEADGRSQSDKVLSQFLPLTPHTCPVARVDLGECALFAKDNRFILFKKLAVGIGWRSAHSFHSSFASWGFHSHLYANWRRLAVTAAKVIPEAALPSAFSPGHERRRPGALPNVGLLQKENKLIWDRIDDLAAALRTQYPGMNASSFKWSRIKGGFDAELRHLQDLDILVSVDGTGALNSVHLPPGSVFVSLGRNMKGQWGNMADFIYASYTHVHVLYYDHSFTNASTSSFFLQEKHFLEQMEHAIKVWRSWEVDKKAASALGVSTKQSSPVTPVVFGDNYSPHGRVCREVLEEVGHAFHWSFVDHLCPRWCSEMVLSGRFSCGKWIPRDAVKEMPKALREFKQDWPHFRKAAMRQQLTPGFIERNTKKQVRGRRVQSNRIDKRKQSQQTARRSNNVTDAQQPKQKQRGGKQVNIKRSNQRRRTRSKK